MWPKLKAMKFLTLVAVGLIGLNAIAQNASMAYNPDSNGDDLIGATDLISLLGLYSTLMIDTSSTCDYEGTEIEQLISGSLSEDLILDSVYVEYLLIDSQLTYTPGCPDPFWVDLVLDRSYIMVANPVSISGDYVSVSGETYYLGEERSFHLSFNSQYGVYSLRLRDYEISELTYYNYDSKWTTPGNCCQNLVELPFPESWTLNEDGIQVSWEPYRWVHNCEHFRLIPYWHAAE